MLLLLTPWASRPSGSGEHGVRHIKMEPHSIREYVSKLETTKSLDAEAAWVKLRPLGINIVPYLVEAYPRMKKWQGRVSLVFYSIRYAKDSEDAYRLGLMALNDRATLVRYRACGLLAYSQRKDAIPYLKKLLKHRDNETVADARAAIYAIKKRNHHYFIDRDHSGKTFWQVTENDKHAEQGHSL